MSKTPRILGVTGGAVGLSALALAFGVCCVAPWAVTLLGVAGAVLLARLSFIQPYVVAGTIMLLGIGFWFVYRRPRAVAACDVVQHRCARDLGRCNRRSRCREWSTSLAVIAAGRDRKALYCHYPTWTAIGCAANPAFRPYSGDRALVTVSAGVSFARRASNKRSSSIL